jgi:hypothetical protein
MKSGTPLPMLFAFLTFWMTSLAMLMVLPSNMTEPASVRITLDFPLAAARAMQAANPSLRFCFVSGRSADPTEHRRSLFARIKGRAERQLAELGLPLFVSRPGYIRPTALSKTRQDFARFLAPIGTLLGLLNADYSANCDQLAHCLLDVAKHGSDHSLLVNSELRGWQMR